MATTTNCNLDLEERNILFQQLKFRIQLETQNFTEDGIRKTISLCLTICSVQFTYKSGLKKHQFFFHCSTWSVMYTCLYGTTQKSEIYLHIESNVVKLTAKYWLHRETYDCKYCHMLKQEYWLCGWFCL